MGVRSVLAACLLFVATVNADGNIEFWREDVTLTCPEEGKWFYDGKNLTTEKQTMYTFKYESKINKPYTCKYGEDESGETTYYFYMKGKTCTNCFELDAYLFGVIIIVDVIATAAVMMIIYKYTKKKGSTGATQTKTPSRSGPAPPTPSRDYEQLNIHTRSQDTYSIVNRTG